MGFSNLYCLITMEKSPAKQQPFDQLFAFIQVLWFQNFLARVSCINSFFSRCWSVFQFHFEFFKSRIWDEKSQDFDLCPKQSCLFNNEKKDRGGGGGDDESLSREEVEMVMRNLTLFCSPEGGELPQKLGSGELSRLYEEKEPSLEEVKEAFDVFDENKDGFIDATELQRVLCILGMKEGFELENCVKMIKTFDENGDGRIDFNEFVKFMETSFVE